MAPKMNANVIDLKNIKTYMKSIFSKPLVSKNQVKWLNLQDFVGVTDEANGWTIGGQNNPTTSLVRNNCKEPLYVQGIKVLTYTNTNGGSGVNDLVSEDENAPVEYFNLQGMKVAGDQPGLYIRRQGSQTTKVVIK